MIIAVGSDHGGYALKSAVLKHLEEAGHVCRDFGTDSEDSVDYPDYGEAVALSVAGGECELGVVICGTGIGISIAANKVPGARCALCANAFMAQMSRRHNDANILALGARVTGAEYALFILDEFLKTGFEGERHARRVAKLSDIERRHGGLQDGSD